MPAPQDVAAAQAAELLAQVQRERTEVAQAEAEVERAVRQQEMRDRSAVTVMVMFVFAAALLLSLVVLLVAGLASGKWETLAPNVADILKSVVLPIVTLVLGYYFGRGGRG